LQRLLVGGWRDLFLPRGMGAEHQRQARFRADAATEREIAAHDRAAVLQDAAAELQRRLGHQDHEMSHTAKQERDADRSRD
jgi:hypothetical protein